MLPQMRFGEEMELEGQANFCEMTSTSGISQRPVFFCGIRRMVDKCTLSSPFELRSPPYLERYQISEM